jgi:hypothetical protein
MVFVDLPQTNTRNRLTVSIFLEVRKTKRQTTF